MIGHALALVIVLAFLAAPALAAEQTWFALAVDDWPDRPTTDVGYAVGTGPSAAEARLDAKRKCLAAGNRRCEVVQKFSGPFCAAYVASETKSGSAVAPTEDDAIMDAAFLCGDKKAFIVVTVCKKGETPVCRPRESCLKGVKLPPPPELAPVSWPPAKPISNACVDAEPRYHHLRNRFEPQGDTVREKETGLVWQRCSLGQRWTGTRCAGEVRMMTGHEALALRQDGWRLPTEDELRRLSHPVCMNPAIDRAAFPDTPGVRYWTGSLYHYAAGPPALRYHNFAVGDSHWDGHDHLGAVRLVRDVSRSR